MSWHFIDRVQLPAALMLRGEIDIAQHIKALTAKSKRFENTKIAQGGSWLAVFGCISDENAPILPLMGGAIALYEVLPNCWHPVGVELKLPSRLQADFVARLRVQHELSGAPLIVIPNFEREARETSNAEIFVIRDPQRLGDIVLPEDQAR